MLSEKELKKILYGFDCEYTPQLNTAVNNIREALIENLIMRLKKETNFQVQAFIKKLIEELNEDNQQVQPPRGTR